MEKKLINSWQWQENFGFSQAVEVSGGQQTLYCAGQAAMSVDGAPLHQGDMRGQIQLALNNLEVVLNNGGFDLSNVVRLNIYTTDLDRFFDEYREVMTRLAPSGCKPA